MNNLRLVTVKESSQLPKFEGIEISFQIMDGNIEAVSITQGDKMMRVVKNGTYTDTLKVLVEKGKEYITTYRASYTDANSVTHSCVKTTEEEAKYWLDCCYLDSGTTIHDIEKIITEVEPSF